MPTTLITGGSGLVGSALTERLLEEGGAVIVLTRDPKRGKPRKGVSYAAWNPAGGTIDEGAVAAADAIVHLAGANVADKRWTQQRKQEIRDSRVQSGLLLVEALKRKPNKVRTVLSASAIGWYGPDPRVPNPHPFTEEAPAHDDFLGQTCRDWEGSIDGVNNTDARLVLLRIGIVLSRKGGAYAEFRKSLPLGVAPVLGGGAQVVSWIHIDDLTALILTALKDERFRGVYNAVAPHPVTNRELISAMAATRRLALKVPVPAAALRLALGEMSIEVLKSATVSGRKAEAAGFAYRYPHIKAAVRQLES